MAIHRLFIKLFAYLFGPLFLVLLLHLIPAFSAPITMEYSLGFNGLFQLNKWTPLNVVLENRGRTTNGTLEVVVTSGSEYRRNVHYATYSMDVELPINSKKLYSFTVLIDSFAHPLVIRLKQAEKTILSPSLNLRPHYTTKSLVLVVGNKIFPDSLSMLPRGVLPVISRYRFLPETWYGYDGVEIGRSCSSHFSNLKTRTVNAISSIFVSYEAGIEVSNQHLLAGVLPASSEHPLNF